ncbi:hypothetical protein MH117_11510 [Paenibacillus sp. ACRRX]|uniref:hypothetical protein n=1 Tax=unclassified Paenibacillus TaxID=185978 RepID=UPI001EF438F5|nr:MULTISPECIES: hypothetical protein [unclassified Paenibacillus]MCG7408047.1 hypothetical protein [Paenibacillus sp. ACRRX]MDK8181570.1 hypothetical protein [Paenibacillus sp. UMB4589-SE434]
MGYVALVLVVGAVLGIILLGGKGASKYRNDRSRRPGSARSARSRTRNNVFTGRAPEHLGSSVDDPVYPLVLRYERSWYSTYEERLKLRVLADNTNITDEEYGWRKLELDRYFILCAVLKEAPMFSRKIDEMWHEMLMFTSDYDQWSARYIGVKIHHQPAPETTPTPGLRAWFDWVYSQLFGPTPYTRMLWGAFFRHPLEPELLEQLAEDSEDELLDHVFRRDTAERYPEVLSAIRFLIQRAKDQVTQAKSTTKVPDMDQIRIRSGSDSLYGDRSEAECPANASYDHLWYSSSLLMVVGSYMTFDHYEEVAAAIEHNERMDRSIITEDVSESDKRHNSNCSSSGCSSDYSSSDCSSSDGGGSSSSCGAGCGSSD